MVVKGLCGLCLNLPLCEGLAAQPIHLVRHAYIYPDSCFSIFIKLLLDGINDSHTINTKNIVIIQPMSTFKVLQFNMQFGQGWDDANPDNAPVDIARTIAEIRSHDADVVLLQEVEHAMPGGVQLSPPPNYTHLSKALDGYHGFFSYPKADPRELPFGIGLAIFSKTPLFDTVTFHLPSPPIEFEFAGEQKTPTDRLLIGAKTTIGGHELQLFNTHLLAFFMLNSSSEHHTSQRQLVIEQLCKSTGPTLLGGDFNVSKHDSLVRQFADAGYRAVQTQEVTWRRRPYVLDHIFYNKHLSMVRHAVIPTDTSDHHMLMAEFAFAD